MLATAAAPLSGPRLARAKFDLAFSSRAEGDYAAARQYAEEASIALRTAEESLRLNQQIREFLVGLPR